MNKNLIWKLLLIVALAILALWVVYPPQEKLKKGRDLAGGTSLVYEIDTTHTTAEERKGLEDTFRSHVQWQLDEKELNHTHISFLPNMEYSRPMSNHLMALALGDPGKPPRRPGCTRLPYGVVAPRRSSRNSTSPRTCA